MTLTIKIKMDNAAFEDSGEVERILQDIAASLGERTLCPGFSQGIYDLNGNRVGEAKVTR